MNKAYQTSGKIFEQVSKRYNPGLLEQIRDTDPKNIILVKGVHDHIEMLLDTIKIPYTPTTASDLPGYNGGRIMLVNCMSYGTTGEPADTENGTVSKKLKDTVREFVSGGGRLVTTDWALGLVQKTFAGKLKYKSTTQDDVVEIQAHSDIARRFIGANYAQCSPKWWLEGSSYVFDIGQGVIPIITSEEMKEKYGQPYVAVGFAEGKGEVFHFISHMELQRTKLKSKADSGGLDDFLQKMKVEKTPEMEDAKVAELEAAFSTLNTLAHLCTRAPILNIDMKSVYAGSSLGGAKSKKLV